ncbi:MAG: two-component regulator propeller domain-containing protein [Bacteroidota bacterium]
MSYLSIARSSFVCFVLAAAMLVVAPALGQDGQWEAHTSFRQANSIASSVDAVWVATRGGVYRYEPASGEKSRFTIADGLYGVDVRSLAFDERRGAVWLGYTDGAIDRLDSESGTVRTFYDIQRSDRYPVRGINRIVPQGDSLYFATDFGIIVFDARPERLEVRDMYAQLGPAADIGDAVHDVVRFSHDGRDYLAAATSGGVAIGPARDVNLQDMQNWIFRSLESPALSIAFFDGLLYAGTEDGLFRMSLDGTPESVPVNLKDVRQMAAVNDRLFGVERFTLFEIAKSGDVRKFSVTGQSAPRAVTQGPDGRLWVADANSGAVALPNPLPISSSVEPEVSETYPDGPYHGRFSTVLTDPSGNVWAGGLSETGTGVYLLDAQKRWTSFVGALYPELQGRSGYDRLAVDPSGNLWAGAFGRAIIRISPDEEIDVFDQNNSLLRGAGDPNFIVVGGVGIDAAGTLWATNLFTEHPLKARSADGEWFNATPRCDGFTMAGNLLETVYVDGFGNKWFVVSAESNRRTIRGLLSFDSGRSISDGDDDHCRFFNREGDRMRGVGLPSTTVHAVAEDRDGRLWVATEAGIAFMTNSSLMPQSSGDVFIWPQPSDRSLGNFLFYGLPVRNVTADPANRIWFATGNGAYAIADAPGGGFDIVAHFTTDNSPLPSNSVTHIAVDGQSGRIFFNTDRGMVSYQGSAVDPVLSADNLLVYPNPVRIEGDASPTIHIRGLVESTDLRIVTASGELVSSMSTRGGQATWDGRDLSGHRRSR